MAWSILPPLKTLCHLFFSKRRTKMTRDTKLHPIWRCNIVAVSWRIWRHSFPVFLSAAFWILRKNSLLLVYICTSSKVQIISKRLLFPKTWCQLRWRFHQMASMFFALRLSPPRLTGVRWCIVSIPLFSWVRAITTSFQKNEKYKIFAMSLIALYYLWSFFIANKLIHSFIYRNTTICPSQTRNSSPLANNN